MKKLRYLLLLPFLLLTSCGEVDYTGTYVFALGNQSSAHISVAATLSSEEYKPHNGGGQLTPTDASTDPLKKQFIFSVDYKEPKKAMKLMDTEVINPFEGSELFPKAVNESSEVKIEGYYYFGTSNSKGLQVHVGIQDLDEMFEQTFGWKTTSEQIMQYICSGYVNQNTFTLYLPVSFNDLIYQLLWYGFVLDFEQGSLVTDLFMNKNVLSWPVIGNLPLYEERTTEKMNALRVKLIGETPKPEDITYILGLFNISDLDSIFAMYKQAMAGNPLFRKFYTVKLGLTKY